MKLAILDDWFDTLRGLPCFSKLDGLDVTVFADHLPETSALVERLRDFDAVVLFRERTAVTVELLDQLPNLKLISQRSVYPHVDVHPCTLMEFFCARICIAERRHLPLQNILGR
jgi:D-3-phosphoglycerate dehydrogenase